MENKSMHSFLLMSLRSHMKHSFHVFDHALKHLEEINISVSHVFIHCIKIEHLNLCFIYHMKNAQVVI